MISVSRTSDPSIIPQMLPHFVVPTGEPGKLEFARQLAEMMDRPDVFVLVVMSDKVGLIGFVVAQALSDHRTTILQAWAHPSAGYDIADQMHYRMVLWTLALGKTEIEVRTTRSVEALYRRFGYEQVATILSHKLNPDLIGRVMKTFEVEEVPNG